MIREEFSYSDVAAYLHSNIDLIIVGPSSDDERSSFFFNEWNSMGKTILLLKRGINESLQFQLIAGGALIQQGSTDLCVGTKTLLRSLGIERMNIMLDLSSLDHVLIMFLTKQLVQIVVPRTLFASYIRPLQYGPQMKGSGVPLSTQVMAVEAVPTFARRECDNQTLCAFIGFEGVRLKSVIETVHGINRLIPIIAFPSGSPEWYNVAMWNSMDILQSESQDTFAYKCFSESVFGAIELLQNNIQPDEKLVLAPLGTRPHSMACALFACQHPHARIIHDYAVEHPHRAIGIANIKVYHLSSFLKT